MATTELEPQHLTYSKSGVPLIGALVDYVETSYVYLRHRTFAQAEQLHAKVYKATLSSSFLATVCLLLGLAASVKFEAVTMDAAPLEDDLHFLLMSKEENLYIDDIDVSRVMWCIEMSDLVVVLFSTFLVWHSKNMRSPLSEYMYLPWLGVTLRGLFLRQAPTAAALIYTMTIVNGFINPLFFTSFALLFLLESRLWLEVARLVCLRWERRDLTSNVDPGMEVETLWSNDDVQSVEVRSYVY